MKTLLAGIVAVVLFSGCHHSTDDPPAFAGSDGFMGDNQLAERASFDLACPRGQLRLHDLGGMGQYGVAGCGRRATYVRTGAGWIMNSQVAPDGP